MAGYSKTPLVKKLGIKAGMRVHFVNAPVGFVAGLGLPDGVDVVGENAGNLDFILLFCPNTTDMTTQFSKLADRLVANGMLWVAWYKKAAKIPTDLSDGVVREYGLNAGMVDVKVCAIDENWSGLKFVYRLKDR
jgi:hypothetical protein